MALLAEQLPFTHLLNQLFGGPVYSLLKALHVPQALEKLHQHPIDPAAPISNFVSMQILVLLILVAMFLYVRSRLSVDKPGALQHVIEGARGFIEDQSQQVIGGHHYSAFTPFLMSLGFFILSCNLIGLIPGFESPTAVPSVPLGCALTAWTYYHAQGLRQNNIAYFKHFMGPVWWLVPLMLPIEVFSHIARVLSLTIRLFANMFAGDMVTLVFFSLVPVAVPVVFMGLHLGVSFIQTYIFVLLATVYLSEATAHEH